MHYIEQELEIETLDRYGSRPSWGLCADIFRPFAPLWTYSVRMALEGASVSHGAPPLWLRRSADVRVCGFSARRHREKTVVILQAPPLGEAAPELYEQKVFWETRPDPKETAVNVLARILNDVRSANAESPLYDRALLNRVRHLDLLLRKQVQAIYLPAGVRKLQPSVVIDHKLVETAAELSDRTPVPTQARLVGRLDMLRHSTRSFGLLLEDGTEVKGVVPSLEHVEHIKGLLGQKILVLGKAVYRPSGSLLRIDAEELEAGEGQPVLFTKVPTPREVRPHVPRSKPFELDRKGVPAFFGIWPGEETDEELLAALEEVRR